MGPRRVAVAVAAALAGAGLLVVPAALANPGDLDPSFGTGGKATISIFGVNSTDRITHVTQTPDGRYVVVGSTDAVNGGDFAVARFTSDGKPDPTFGSGGKTNVSGPTVGGNDVGGGVAVQADEKVVVAGFTVNGANFIAKRLNANGTSDATFAGGASGGTALVNFGASVRMNQMIAQFDGKLVLVGFVDTNGGDIAIARLNADGTPDTTFSGDGKTTLNPGGADEAVSVAIQPDGKLVVAGYSGSDMVVSRLFPDGSLDASFGVAGTRTIDFGGNEVANGVAVQQDGKIVVAGTTDAVGSGDYAVARLTADGNLDTSFSDDGKTTAGFGAASEFGLAVALQQNGRIVVTGQAHDDFVTARFNADGTPDTTFGTNGSVSVDFGGTEYDGDVLITPGARIVIAGSTNAANLGMVAAGLLGDPPPGGAGLVLTAGGGGAGGGGGGGGGGGATPAAPPKIVVTTHPSADGKGVIIDTTGTTGATTIQVDVDGDGVPDYTVPAGLGVVEIRDPVGGTKNVTVTAVGDGGSTSQNVTVTIPGLGAQAASTVPQVAVFSQAAMVPKAPTCTQASVIQGLVDARGCFLKYNDPKQVPRAEQAAARVYYGASALPKAIADRQPCAADDKVCQLLTRFYTKNYLVYVSTGTVRLNGLTVTPASGHAVVFDPNATRVFSSSATVKLGSIRIRSGRVDFDFTDMIHHTGKAKGVDVLTGFTKPVLSFNARDGLPFIGGFPVDAGAQLAFGSDRGVRQSKVSLNVHLPKLFDVFGSGDQPHAAGTGVATNDRDFHVDTLDIAVPHASIAGIGFDNILFHYAANGDAAAGCSRDYWHGTANISLGKGPNGEPGAGFILTPPPIQNGIAFCNGAFKSAGGSIVFGVPIPPPQLFPGVLLNQIDFAMQLNPVVLHGGATISAVDLFRIQGALLAVFATPGRPYNLTKADAGAALQDIAPRRLTSTTFAVGGALAINVPFIGTLDVAHGAAMYAYPNYVAAFGRVDAQLGIFVFHGSLGGQLDAFTRHFEVDLKADICLRGVAIACAGGLGIVSSRGVVACLDIGPLHPGVGLKTNLRYEVWLIDGCKPSHYWVRDIAAPRASAAQAADGKAFDVAQGETTKNIELDGDGGAPKVQITGPGGVSLTLDQDGLTQNGALVGLRSDQFNATYIGLDHAPAGHYTIMPLDGSVPLGALSTTLPGYDTNFTGSVSGKGAQRTLTYDARKKGGGQEVTFYEDGTNVSHELGTSTGGKGTIRFTPAPGQTGVRKIVARATVDGSPIADQTIATFRYTAPAPLKRPRHVTAIRKGKTLTIRWDAVVGAAHYGIVVNRGGGSQQRYVLPARRRSLKIRNYPLTEGGNVTVSAQDALGDWGPSRRSTSFKRVKAPDSIFLEPRKSEKKA